MTSDFLTNSFSLLTTKISKLNKYKYKADGIFTENYNKIKESHEQLPEWAINKKDGEISFFYFQSPSTGEDISLTAPSLKLEDQLELNTLQKLKMYHWLLAEGFEEFEKFVVKAYAYCGVEGINIWTQPKGWKHENSRDINHYLKKLYGEPFTQLDDFRASSDHFAKFETNGPTQTNYRVVFALIEQFRHRIVHNGGYCKDLQIFLDGIQKRLPDIDRKTYSPFVESYFFLHGEDHLIDLLEYEAFDDDGTPNGCYHDTVSHFLRLLVEYAQLIVESIRVHPVAERNRQ